MGKSSFDILLWAMTGMGLVVFIALYFVRAGYGMFRTRQWGPSIDNRTGWVLMEAPSIIVTSWLWAQSDLGVMLPQCLFLLLFLLHYAQRTFVFPFLMTGRSRMPLSIVLMGAVFNVLNGVMQAGGLCWFPPADYAAGAGYLAQPHVWAGFLLFAAGMGVNLHSDHVIRHLRRPGDTRHYLPQRGMYRYVTSANYLGELAEWTGFALMAATPAAWVFVWWTAANLVPRADAIHKKYRAEFGDEAVGRRKRILPFVY